MWFSPNFIKRRAVLREAIDTVTLPPVYTPIIDAVYAEGAIAMTADGDSILAISGYILSNPATTIPVVAGSAPPVIGSTPIPASEPYVPETPTTFPAGSYPLWATLIILGHTANVITLAVSVRYYPNGTSNPTYDNRDCTMLITYFESRDNGMTFSQIGANSEDLDFSLPVLTLNTQSPANAYIVLDAFRNKLFQGTDGVAATLVANPFGTESPMIMGCSDSQFVIITAPFNTVYTSSDGRVWTNKGAAIGLPYYLLIIQTPTSYNYPPSTMNKVGGYWHLLNYRTADPDAKTGWTEVIPVYPDWDTYALKAGTRRFVSDHKVHNGTLFLAEASYTAVGNIQIRGLVTSVDGVTWNWVPDSVTANGLDPTRWFSSPFVVLGEEFLVYNRLANFAFRSSAKGTIWTSGEFRSPGMDNVSLNNATSVNRLFIGKMTRLTDWPTPNAISNMRIFYTDDKGMNFSQCVIPGA